jgi:hypothetical protein
VLVLADLAGTPVYDLGQLRLGVLLDALNRGSVLRYAAQ